MRPVFLGGIAVRRYWRGMGRWRWVLFGERRGRNGFHRGGARFCCAQGKPFCFAQGKPFCFAQGKPFCFAQGKPFCFAQGKEDEEKNGRARGWRDSGSDANWGSATSLLRERKKSSI